MSLHLTVFRDRVPLYHLKRNERGAVEVHMHYWPRPFEVSCAAALHAFVRPYEHLIGVGGLVAIKLFRGGDEVYNIQEFIEIGQLRKMERVVDDSWEIFCSAR